MLRPFSNETTVQMLNMFMVSLILDNQLDSKTAVENPQSIESLADCLINICKHNYSISQVKQCQALQVPSVQGRNVIEIKGRTFEIIEGGGA